jgi:TolA-binding protein
MTDGRSNQFNAPGDPASAARAAMLRMAKSAQEKGLVYHAIHTYTSLMDQYPQTPEARRAAEEMIALAQFLEEQGMYHTALSLYEQLGQYR